MSAPGPSPAQKRILWLAVTALAVVVFLASIGALIWGLGRILQLFAPVLWPLALAAALAYLLDPVVDLLERRKIPRPRAILLVFGLALAAVIGIGALFIPRLVVETRQLSAKVPEYARNLQQRGLDLVERAESSGWKIPFLNTPHETTNSTNSAGSLTNLPPETASSSTNSPALTATDAPLDKKIISAAVSWLPKALPAIGNWLTDQISRVAAWFGLLAGIALVPVYCFYFLLEKKGIESRWTDYLPVQESSAKQEIIFALKAINDRLIVFFRGQVLVAACDGALYGLLFACIGLNYALLLGLFAAVVSIIPFIGATITFVIAMVLALVQFHDWLHPLLVVGVFAVVQAMEGLVISPKIIGDRVGLHPLTIIIAVMAGTTLLGGVLGGILAIPLTAALRELMFRYVWKKR